MILPWECATKEVQQDIGKWLEVVLAGLLYAQVSIDRGVPGGACYELVNLSLSYDSNLCVKYQAKPSSTEIQVKATIS